MVTSATLFGDTVEGSENSYLDWQVVSQNVSANTTTIAWQVGWRFDQYSCRGLRLGHAVINGVTVYDDDDPGDGVHIFNSGHNHDVGTFKLQTASGTRTIAHNADGSKTFSASVTLTGWQGQTSNNSGSWALPTIPRLSGAPSKPVISSLTNVSMFVTFTDGSGGAPIDSRQIRYGIDSQGVGATIISSDGSTSIGSLLPGIKYYIWARTHNVAGFSPWSARAEVTMHDVPNAPNTPSLINVSQVEVSVTWIPPFNGGSIITSYQVAYNTSNTVAGATIVSGTSPKVISGLIPGTKYYFFVRAINTYGNGLYSQSANATTIAGARVKQNGVWKPAIPYVRVAGVWELARPWVKKLGIWKETI